MDFDTRYSKLNARQKEAVDLIDGPLMVVAGPGTGKTELLSMRTANILKRTDTLPENILCLTFTESGATAMRRRLSEIIGADAYRVAIHTFHSFGSEIINQYGEYFYHGAHFRPASELSAYELLRSLFDALDFSNPLSGKMNDEYTHLSDSLTTISELKKSGLTNEELLRLLDANDAVLDLIETDVANVFSSRISKNTAGLLTPVATKLAEFPAQDLPPGVTQLATVLALSIAHAVDEATDQDSTKPITAWKNTHLEKDEENSFVFKDRRRSRKLRALSYLYYQYLMKMQEAELYDFDDMVLRVVHAMEVFPDLRYNLQEKYLYTMVDEFQDTNLAQARILYNLAAAPSGDEPNIMVVGDDDQAIYSFQGAEVGNILNFRDKYESVKLITLTDNYRSAGIILEKARGVITQGHDRLERYLEGIDKTLTPHFKASMSEVRLREYARIEDERRGTARSVKAQIKAGALPGSVAVLARRHHELVALLPYFAAENIVVNYEHRDNVLESDVIVQLLHLSNVISYLAEGSIDEADAILPQILAHPAWGYDTASIWQLSLNAHKQRSSWLEQMSLTPTFQPFHKWLLETSRFVDTESAEHSIDMLVGTPDEDRSDEKFHSPLYEFFFSDEMRLKRPDEYVIYLEALRTIRAKLREYRPNQLVGLNDFIEFVELHQQLGSSITSVRTRSSNSIDAVNLMTAHKSKGLEFDHVHIVGAVDKSWGERVRSRSRLIGYPENLPIRPSGDSLDERLRLFFVAMTRARISLSISYASSNEAGQDMLVASFLMNDSWQAEIIPEHTTPKIVEQQLRHEWYQPFVTPKNNSIEHILKQALENYKLSATHLTSFLDVTRGGPQYFLINNILRFPTSKKASALYGSAIHGSLQRAHSHLMANGISKPDEDVLQDFESLLTGYHMTAQDFQTYLQRGTASLMAFLAAKYDTFTPQQKVEISFAGQQSVVNQAHLTGTLDLMDINSETREIIVTDYKTGHPSNRWYGKTDGEKLKLHTYRQQLMFYKLLVEHSRDYANYAMTKGVLQFVEPTIAGQIVHLDLEIDSSELKDFTVLVENVFRLITSMALPDATIYPPTHAGVIAFESDIKAGKY